MSGLSTMEWCKGELATIYMVAEQVKQAYFSVIGVAQVFIHIFAHTQGLTLQWQH